MGRLRDLRLGVRNVVRWLPVIWRDRDWDHDYLTRIMATKMRFMADYHERHGVSTDAPHIAAELRRAAWLIENASEAAWCDHDYFRPGMTYDERRSRRYLEEFCRIVRRKLLTWWD